MKAKVLERLKLKAKDFGFTDEELKTVCEPIANQLAQKEDATDDDIDKAVEIYLPILKLSQSASNRSFEKMKKQFEEQNNASKKKEEEEAKKKAEEEAKKKAEETAKDEPDWFKSYRESMETKFAEQAKAFEDYKKTKNNEGYLSLVKKGLKDVDPSFYNLMLEGRTFENEEAANNFVTKVTSSWENFCKERKLDAVKKIVPPAGGDPVPEKPSEGVLKRIEERKKKAEALKDNNVFKGLPSNV